MVVAQGAGPCYVFNNDPSQGMTFGEVLELQRFLASEGSFTAEMNGTFGPLTKAALARYQSGNGIPATGYFGPATRAHVNARCGEVLGAFSSDTGSYGPYSAIAGLPDLKTGTTHEGVALIQQFLNAHGFAVSPVAGQPGSVGYEANYFGPATQKAVAAYQASQGISPATGVFGPVTRAAMASTQN